MFFFVGDTQLKIICFFSAIGLFITIGITCHSVSERVLIKRGYALAEITLTQGPTRQAVLGVIRPGVNMVHNSSSPASDS
jgi:hypothetical protein